MVHSPRAALEAGKHVLVEKPMSSDLVEAAELVELARHSPGHLVPAPHVVLSPTYQRIVAAYSPGRYRYTLLGPCILWLVRPRLGGSGSINPGGGSMYDLGVYNVVTLTGLLGPAKRVTGMVGTAIKERMVEGEMTKVESDDNAHICIEFAGTCYAVITTGFTIQKYRTPAVEIYGSTGDYPDDGR